MQGRRLRASWVLLVHLALLASAVAAAEPSEVALVAHRGASHDAPENTAAAFVLAWERGADAIEADFHLTADERIVAIHDATTGRTSDEDWRVSERTLAELRTLDVGRWKGRRWAGQRIPTLPAVLAVVPEGGRIFIEIKTGPELVPHLERVLAEREPDRDQLVVISFNKDVIAAVKERMPWLTAHWLTAFERDEETGDWKRTPEQVIETAESINADGVDLRANAAVDEELAEAVRAAGLELHVWTVNDPAVAIRMAELGVDSITTDRPGFLREAMEDRPQPAESAAGH